MLTVSYFCIATEIRFLKDNKDITDHSEYWHYKAVEIACTYLPASCPIVKHYISSYDKHYSSILQIIVNTF